MRIRLAITALASAALLALCVNSWLPPTATLVENAPRPAASPSLVLIGPS